MFSCYNKIGGVGIVFNDFFAFSCCRNSRNRRHKNFLNFFLINFCVFSCYSKNKRCMNFLGSFFMFFCCKNDMK